MHTNATHSLFKVSSLNGYRDDCFTLGTAASFAGSLATDEAFIYFHSSG
jgi:hypothetical protein